MEGVEFQRPVPSKSINSRKGAAALRVGFVPLVDAAPLVAAAELGHYADEGLDVALERQIGWGNVRDKLTFGHLDAAHALVGLPVCSNAPAPGWGDAYAEPLVSLMGLSSAGDAITLSARLAEAGVATARDLARWLSRRRPASGEGDQRPTFAHVFGCSMHHYLLRDWLAAGGVDPDVDLRLAVLPPSQMAAHVAGAYLEGFCAGEPFNTLAQREGVGRVAALTADILPAHPEKVLAVSRQWADRHGDVLVPLVRATLRGCAFCDDPANAPQLAEWLARPRYLGAEAGVDAAAIAASLALDRTFPEPEARRGERPTPRPAGWRVRSFGPEATFPSRTHVAWLLGQMARWGHVPADVDAAAVAARCCDSGPYRAAARSLGVACPETEYPPMQLAGGRWLDIDPATHSRGGGGDAPTPVRARVAPQVKPGALTTASR